MRTPSMVLILSLAAGGAHAQQAAAPYPPALVDQVKALAARCVQAGGTPGNGDRPLVYPSFDLDGDGVSDFILDEAGLGCAGHPGFAITAQGAGLAVFSGSTGANLYQGTAFTFRVTSTRPPELFVTHKGADCGAQASAQTTCETKVSFTAATPAAAAPVLSPADQAAAYRAAGFALKGGKYQRCDDPGTATYEPGAIQAMDLNGDGLPEAVITEGGSYCFGNTGTGFVLVTKSASGVWKVLADTEGVFTPMQTRNMGWPDIMIGGPGFEFPIWRYNGQAYVFNRTVHDG